MFLNNTKVHGCEASISIRRIAPLSKNAPSFIFLTENLRVAPTPRMLHKSLDKDLILRNIASTLDEPLGILQL